MYDFLIFNYYIIILILDLLSFGISVSTPIFSVSLSAVSELFCAKILDNLWFYK